MLTGGNWHFIVGRIDMPNDKIALAEIYDSTGTLLEEVSDTATDLATYTSDTDYTTLRFQRASDYAQDIYIDNVIIDDAYDADILTWRNITAYSQYANTLAPLLRNSTGLRILF